MMQDGNMRFTFVLIMILCSTWCWWCDNKPVEPQPDGDLPYVNPEQVGYDSDQLKAAADFGEQIGYTALMAAYDGQVFFSWGNTTYNYKVHSIRKPFLSSLYGIHVNSGVIDLNATMADLAIDDYPPSLTETEKQATVRYLLQSRSGIYHEAAAETDMAKQLRPERGSHPPGTYYYYNNWDFNVAGTIFEQETGTGIFEEFDRRIAKPVGMQDFDMVNCYYQYEAVSMHPAYSFRMSTRDMLRFGILYQKNGNWDGKQIIPQNWIIVSTTAYSQIDTSQGIGYGYMWNVIEKDTPAAHMIDNHAVFFHTGIGVHLLMIIPDYKLVLVMRMDTDGDFTDPGDDNQLLSLMIINARTGVH